MNFIHQKGLELSRSERLWMEKMASSEEEKILKVFQNWPHHKFPAHQIARITGIKKGHTRRSLTNLAQEDPEKPNHLDDWNQPALIKLGKDEKVIRWIDEDRSVHVSCWTYNEKWRTKPARERRDPPVDREGQALLFKPESRDGVQL